jgi:uncharacterized protein YaaN involved in tellurite resistance
MPQELNPPETLAVPQPVEQVSPQEAGDMVKLKPEVLPQLQERVKDFVDDVLQFDTQSEDFKNRIAAVNALGVAEARQAASVSNRMLERPMNAANSGLFDNGSPVGKSLIDLRKTVEDLDPSRQGDLFAPKKLFGIIPMGDRLRDYFLKYQSAQSHINTILNTLYKSQDELRKDNATIEQEKANLWNLMQTLQGYVYVGRLIDKQISEKLPEIEAKDAEKARVVKEEILFNVRQKVTDLLTQLAVSVQGYLALDLIKKNNVELIKGVDRATTTTVSALRTAVIVAQALANQKLVLDQITALNTTTSNLIESTSAMLKKQSGEIAQQAVSATVNIEQLKTAFANVFSALDTVSEYKVRALDSMQKTIEVLNTEVKQAQSYLDRTRAQTTQQVVDELKLPYQL